MLERIETYFPDQSRVSEMDLLFTENTTRNGNAVADHIFQSIGEFDLHEDLAVITSPTLVIHGDVGGMQEPLAPIHPLNTSCD